MIARTYVMLGPSWKPDVGSPGSKISTGPPSGSVSMPPSTSTRPSGSSTEFTLSRGDVEIGQWLPRRVRRREVDPLGRLLRVGRAAAQDHDPGFVIRWAER